MSNFDVDKFLDSFLDLNISPGRVIFKSGAFNEIDEHLSALGDNFAVITTPLILENFLKFFKKSVCVDLENSVFFTGEICCYEEADRLYELIDKKGGFDGIIAIGGGTVMDIAKLTAFNMRKPLVTIPSSSATCAAATALAVIYSRDGRFKKYDYLSKNSDLCLIEPEFLMTAGARLTSAGMADAIAKYIEGVWSYDGKIPDYYSDLGLYTAYKLYNEILANGKKAIIDIEKGILSREAFDVFSYNILASALSSGIAGMKVYPNIAHSISNGITAVFNGENYTNIFHGEAISFGMAAGMIIMEQDKPKVLKFINGLKQLNLPVSLSEIIKLGNKAENYVITEEYRRSVAAAIVKKAMDPVESIHDIAKINDSVLNSAILETDTFNL
ncbi:MAG: iron-containing alcohol dehydrogenase [Candidatus Wallbacteria bacterium]